MKSFRTELHGHVLEIRQGEWGGEQVLLNGRPISSRPMAFFHRRPHFFDLTDEAGRPRHVEVRLEDLSRLGLGRYRAIVFVDGLERCRLEPENPRRPPDVCRHCGYALNGLEPVRGEVQCPECGRHTAWLGADGGQNRAGS